MMRFRIVENTLQDITIEDLINDEYTDYVISTEPMTESSVELGKAWQIVIDRMLQYGVLETMKPDDFVLLNCPCCGGKADCNDTGVQNAYGEALWWVECLGCGLNTAGSQSKAAAVGIWNKRQQRGGEDTINAVASPE